MFKNYFKSAWRNLLKSKASSSINIIGLAAGMAVTILIGLWIWDEVTFDHYHKNHERLGQVMSTLDFNGELVTVPAVAMPLGDELRNKYGSDFKNISMASWIYDHSLRIGEKNISVQGMWVDSVFPSMFSLRTVEGNVESGLQDPSSILLSASTARALFGDESPINKFVRLDNQENLKVTGVYEDLPENTTLNKAKILLSFDKYKSSEPDLQDAARQWDRHSFQTFVQLSGHIDFSAETEKIKNIPMEHLTEAQSGKEALILHLMDNWRLYNEFKNGKPAGGRIQFVWLFGIIGVFVLLLACINFMNLSTARSEKRAKEVGIRKTIGSGKKQLIIQFLAESVMVAFIALLLSILLTQLGLSLFNSLADKNISIPFGNVAFWAIATGFTLLTGLIAGSYPAFYLSGFKPIKVLKGTFRSSKSAAIPRKILVVTQFSISIILMIGTLILYKQIQFAKNRPAGYSREGLITVTNNTPDLRGHFDALQHDLLSTGVVADVAESSTLITKMRSKEIGFSWQGKDPNFLPLFGTVGISENFGKTVGWKVTEGRDFSKEFADSSSLILNEAAVKLTGIQDIVGKKITWNDKDFTVIGVIKNMIMESPYEPVTPTVFFKSGDEGRMITIRIRPDVSVSTALGEIESVFKKYNPANPFSYSFVDADYAKKFFDEVRIGNLASFFTILALFISCLGLFGLASYIAEQRTKEIGVRKVLGASVLSLWGMLSKEFLLLVIISCLIAIPIAWYGLHQWLQGYSYRTEIPWWIFAAAGVLSVVIAIGTVSYQAIKAAVANPVKSLRTE